MKAVTEEQSDAHDDGRAWAIADFRRLWRASAISSFGSEIGELALPLLAIITLVATPSEVGLLRTAQFVPFLIATLPLGVMVDRLSKRALMMLSDFGRFALVGLIPILIWTGVRQIEVLYVLVFLVGCLTVLYQLAEFAYLPSLVSHEQIVDANGKLSATLSANEIAGKGVGGVIVELLTAPVAVLADAVTYLLSALNLWRIVSREDTEAAGRRGPPLREAREGLRIAVRSRFIGPLLGEATTFNFFNEFFIIGLLLYAVRGIGLGPALIGAVFAAGGIGSFVGAWFGARVTSRFGYGRVLLATMIVGNGAPVGVVFLGNDASVDLLILMVVFLVMGVGVGIANVHAVSLRQTAIAPGLRSSVNAGYRLISWGTVPIGASIGGFLASRVGSYPTMVVGAVEVALATAWVAWSAIPRLASIDDAREGALSDRWDGNLVG